MCWIVQRQRSSKSGVEITITKTLLECGERGFPGAVARGDIFHFELVMKPANDLLDVGVISH